jgi:putative ABC transport system substrate-binding protein
MNRRAFAAGVTLMILGRPRVGHAQAKPGRHRLGILSLSSTTSNTDRVSVAILVPAALHEMGYVEGQDLVVDRRYAEGQQDRLPALARELVQLRPQVILAISPAAVQALRETRTDIPIVMFVAIDPVAQGWVTSLARPGGRITGVIIAPDAQLAAKRLELLREAAPKATRIVALTTDEPHAHEQARVAQRAAGLMGAQVEVVEVRGRAYAQAFEQIVAHRVQALLVVASSILNRDRREIIGLAARHRLPAIYQWSEHADDGGLMSYGSNVSALSRRAAIYVDRLFKGASPADLPVEEPSVYELVINRKTARALGLTLPFTLITRADRIID